LSTDVFFILKRIIYIYIYIYIYAARIQKRKTSGGSDFGGVHLNLAAFIHKLLGSYESNTFVKIKL